MADFSLNQSNFLEEMRKRFYSFVKFNEETWCWDWMGAKNRDGYGKFSFIYFASSAHRISLLLHGLNLKEKMVVDHLCRNPACVNPEHLEQVTGKENCLRGLTGYENARKTHCPKGHPYSGDNLILAVNERGSYKRICKKCSNLRSKMNEMNKSSKQQAKILLAFERSN